MTCCVIHSLLLFLLLSDSEDEVRIVKSAKERSLEAFQTHISNIRVAMKTSNFLTIQSEFDELSKAMIKAKKLLAQGIPRPLVKMLCDLEDYVAKQLSDKTSFKALSASQGRALNRMKLTLNKHNKPYQVVMKEYRKNPMTEEEQEDEEDESSTEKANTKVSKDSSSEEESSEVSVLVFMYIYILSPYIVCFTFLGSLG